VESPWTTVRYQKSTHDELKRNRSTKTTPFVSNLNVSFGLGSDPFQGGGSHFGPANGFFGEGLVGPRLRPLVDEKEVLARDTLLRALLPVSGGLASTSSNFLFVACDE